MRDARRELAERGELLGLDQAILRGAQFLDRLGELLGARLRLLEEPHILDGDHGLVGEGLQKLDLAFVERPHLLARHDEDADRHPFAQERHAEIRPIVAEALIFARGVVRVGEHVGNLDGFAFERDAPRGAVRARREGVRLRILDEFVRKAEIRDPAI